MTISPPRHTAGSTPKASRRTDAYCGVRSTCVTSGKTSNSPVPVPDGRLDAAALDTLVHGFYQAHERTYGYHATDEPTQLVTFCLEARGVVPHATLHEPAAATGDTAAVPVETRQVYLGKADGGFVSSPVCRRQALHPGHRLDGPAIIEQLDTTTLLLPGQQATIDTRGTLVISLTAG